MSPDINCLNLEITIFTFQVKGMNWVISNSSPIKIHVKIKLSPINYLYFKILPVYIHYYHCLYLALNRDLIECKPLRHGARSLPY